MPMPACYMLYLPCVWQTRSQFVDRYTIFLVLFCFVLFPADKLADIGISSNTKVSFFRSYATGVQPFRSIAQNARTPSAFSVMNKLDQDDTCSLHYAADMCKELTAGLLKMKQVSSFRGEVTAANFEDHVRKAI